MIVSTLRSPESLQRLDRVMLVSLLLTPVLLMHTRALAEVTIALIGLGFLGRSAVTRDWTWLRTGWLPFMAGEFRNFWMLLGALPPSRAGG